jgi:hypothetical protein
MSCPVCGPFNAECRRLEIARGIVVYTQCRDTVTTKLVTLTDASVTPLSIETFQRRVSRLLDNLRRDHLGWHGHYSTLGYGAASGRLHRHLVVLGWPDVPPGVLRAHERRAGLGRIDVKQIGSRPQDAARVARYLVFAPGNGCDFARAHPGVQTFSQSRWPA